MKTILQRFVPLLLVIFSLLFINTFVVNAQITIVVNKGKFATVEKAAVSEEEVNWSDGDLSDDRACTECFAAVELANFLKTTTLPESNNIKFTSPEKLPSKGNVFIIGSRNSNPLINSITMDKGPVLKTDQSLRIQTISNKTRTITIIEGKDRVGTLYGVYAYLEHLGFRFYGLGEQGTVYPDNLSSLPDELDIVQNPSFLSRGFYGLRDRGARDMFYWMARNRINFCSQTDKETPFRKKLGMILVAGGHEIQESFLLPQGEYPYNYQKFNGDENKPEDPYAASDEYSGDTNNDGILTYFEAHPEWYGLRNGRRSDKVIADSGDNFCTSNPDAKTELAKNLVQSLIDGKWKNLDIVNFWMLDNGIWCECENCRKQGNLNDRLMDVCYVVLKEIQKARDEKRLNREIILASLAYHETLPPPAHSLPKDFDYDHFSVTFFPIERCYVHSLADPACTEINQFLLENYQGWTMGSGRNYKGSIFIGEYYNVSSFKGLPVVFPHIMTADIPWYYRTGTRHIHYMHTPTHLWGTWTLNQYLFAQLIWDVNTNTDELLDEYYSQYYPTTTETTRKFYEHLEIAFSNIKPYKHYAGEHKYKLRDQLMRDTADIFPLEHMHYEPYHPLINDGPDVVEMIEELTLARKVIDESILKCTDKTEQARLIEDERRFAYGEAMYKFIYHLTRTVMLHRKNEALIAKEEFIKVEKYAEILRNVTDLVAPLPGTERGDANSNNGFEATQEAALVYDRFKKLYGN